MKQKMINFFSVFVIITVITIMSGCSKKDAPEGIEPELNKLSLSNNPDNIIENQVDIENYTATTKEAQDVINKLKAGEIQKPEFINGGITDDMFKQRAEGLQNGKNSDLYGTTLKSGQPSTSPTTADTRPKIYWVGKKYGPAETYYVNAEINDFRIFDAQKPLTPINYKSTTWRSDGREIGFDVVLLQETGTKTSFVGYKDYGNQYFNNKILCLMPYSIDQNYIWFLYEQNTTTNDYVYTDLPSDVFEDPNGYPIMETWYWNPAWHFEKITMKTTSSGEIRYAINTREGFEQQFLLHRWDKNDFITAYLGAGGWHSQGWFIKDFDVENGIVSAILYIPTQSYDEVMMWGVTDEYFNQRIGDTYWPQAYRGLMIDNSW
jgi:hypothetical protein